MLSPDEEYDRAHPERPFSNSSQGYGWMDRNCARCVHDRTARSEEENGPGCPLVLVALMGRTPQQWLAPAEDSLALGDYQCVEFRDEDSGPPPEPTPVPDPPGQLLLLPRAPFEGYRMLTVLPGAAVTETVLAGGEVV